MPAYHGLHFLPRSIGNLSNSTSTTLIAQWLTSQVPNRVLPTAPNDPEIPPQPLKYLRDAHQPRPPIAFEGLPTSLVLPHKPR